MKKTYLVLTDPEKGAREDNWTIMNAFEFARFMETEEGQQRKDGFECLEAADERDDILYIECGPTKKAKLKSERNRTAYLRKVEAETGYEMMSLDQPADMGEEGDVNTLLDLIADEEMNTEEMAIMELLKAELPSALVELDRSELELILSLYVEGDSMTVTTYAKQKGLTRWCARELHKSAIRKLRLHYRKKRLFWNV